MDFYKQLSPDASGIGKGLMGNSMAYKTFETRESFVKEASSEHNKTIHLQIDNEKNIDLPNAEFVHNSQIIRDGSDLILKAENSESIIIDNYYSQINPPNLVAPDGTTLTPTLVNSFARSEMQFATSDAKNDASPIGAVQEIKGEATVTRLDGTVETIGIGTPIFAGDIIETSEDGAVNIIFMDETTFAVSNDAKLAIDEYVFDPSTQSGETNFSVLKGMFVFTSGLIGRDDPDDVHINTPSGSIGIRGTIIAGNVDTGEITVIEGAIVLNDFNGNSITLSSQYETARFNTSGGTIEHIGELTATDVGTKFSGVSDVSGDLFSTIQDKANETQSIENQDNTPQNSSPSDNMNDISEPDSSEDHSALQPLQNFLTSQDIAFAGDEFKILQPLQTLQTFEENKDSTTLGTAPLQNLIGDTTILKPPPIIDNSDRPPFAVTITKLAFSENVHTSSPIAVIKGFFTPETKLVLNDISNNFYQATRVDENTFEITLKSGLVIDAEHAPPLKFTAENESGAAIISDSIKLDVLNVNEPTTIAHNPANEIFQASSGTNWSYNFLNDFHDPDGDIASFSYSFGTGLGTAPVTSYTTDGSSILNINFGAIATGGNFDITVNALDSDGSILNSFTKTFYYFNQNLTMTGTGPFDDNGYSVLTSPGSLGQTVNISFGNNRNVFTNDGIDTINISTVNGTVVHAGNDKDYININSGMGHIVFGENGDDEFNIFDSGNYACGGDGRDTFLITAAANETYGGNDADTFTLMSASILSTTTTRIDGQSGFDTLEFSTGGSINFSSINPNVVRNIENISTNNGNTDNITLSRSDILDMTDESKTLSISMDNNDTLTFVNDSGGTMNFYHLGDIGGREVYSDGIITLLISTEGSHSAIT